MEVHDYKWKYTTANGSTRLQMEVHDYKWKYTTSKRIHLKKKLKINFKNYLKRKKAR